MSKHFKLKRGLNIRLKGTAEAVLEDAPAAKTVALKPTDFPGLTPKLKVKAEAIVKAGDALFFDKYNPEILFTSPVSGTVKAVNRGERRRRRRRSGHRHRGPPGHRQPPHPIQLRGAGAAVGRGRAPGAPVVLPLRARGARGGQRGAAEVLAGALQDHGRARVVGTKSYGKGVVQSVFTWTNRPERVKITTSYYLTPSGRNIENSLRPEHERGKGGIFPDRVIEHVPIHAIAIGGGGIHCITQQQPLTVARGQTRRA